MKEYHDHYLITDKLLLADVFANFRKMSLETYRLDPIHYYSLPCLSWDAMFKYTDVELELITDPDMHQMVEKSMRGGISNICHRYATSHHPNMDTYNENEEPRTLTYQNANSLYSWAMSQMLPLKGFKWVPAPDEIDIWNVPGDSKLGYILEVGLEYPKELHEKHYLHPLASEHIQVTDDMLSPICGSVRKLVPNLRNKKKYVVHYRNLQLYVGMKIKKIHRVMQFEQSIICKLFM